jgi:hypothetical protein
MDMISNTTFADLTGCGAQCSFAQSVLAPSPCFPNLVYAGNRTDADTCLDPSFTKKPDSYDVGACKNVPWNATTGWTLVPPTSIDSSQIPCKPDWLTVSFFFFQFL